MLNDDADYFVAWDVLNRSLSPTRLVSIAALAARASHATYLSRNRQGMGTPGYRHFLRGFDRPYPEDQDGISV